MISSSGGNPQSDEYYDEDDELDESDENENYKSVEDHEPAIELPPKLFDEEPLLKRKSKKLFYSNSELEVALKPPLPKEIYFKPQQVS